MGRLIDADALLEHIKKLECHAENKKYEQGLNDFLQCYLPQIIDNQPTAYDVEKVVEELMVLHEEGYCPNEDSLECVLDKACSDCYREKITDIVKKGGVE